MSVIVVNGPPGSGKDEACRFLKLFGYKHFSFKHHLFRETVKYFNVSLDWFLEGYDNRIVKEAQVEKMLGNRTRREALIYVSEEIIKPNYGKDYFGKKSADEMQEYLSYCFSDGGFLEEILPIINKFGVEKLTLIQLTRQGCDFSSDSRRYISGELVEEFILGKETPISKNHVLPNHLKIRTYRVHNNGTVEQFHSVLQKIHEKETHAGKINKAESNTC